ncbi:hypothetical protein [Microlunatus sp. GCM10028923]|uniref:hypothetical protein n=1 Tax=Microlunatus sp. GCM10028923 TaxID=3273400 RepID=UPI0036195C75
MITLQIEHRISDYPTWRRAFDRFRDVRDRSGVLADRVRSPIDDPLSLIIELDFATADQAAGFRDFLIGKVWSSADTAPALVGAPVTRLLRRPEDPAGT